MNHQPEQASKILLLHGAIASASQMDLLRESLSGYGDIYSFDFAGHGGRSIPEEGYSMEAFAAEINAFIREKIGEPAHVIGYSMGGYAALCAALREPENFRSITTLGSKFDWNQESAQKEVALLDPEKIETKIPAFAEILAKRHHPQDWKTVVRKTADMMLLLGQDAPLKEDTWKKLVTPLHIVCGDRDSTADPIVSSALAEKIPGARFSLLDNSAHPIEKTDIRRFAELWLQHTV